jgi:hypothetical protein
MTAVSALLLAVLTGWLVPAPRLAIAAFLGPWLAVLIYQTADIGLGYAVSPPQTVTQFPRVIGYVVVTAIILALGLVLAALISERRSRAVRDAGRPAARKMVKRAALTGTVVVAALIVLDIADHAVLVWPESTAHHTTNPSPPLFGILSIALCLIGIAVLGTAVLRRRAATLLGRDGTSPDSPLELADHLVEAVRAAGTDVTFRRAGHHLLSASCPPGPRPAEAGG